MEKNDSRTALRLPNEMRSQIKALIKNGQFKSLSDVVREALKEFFGRKNRANFSELRMI